MGSYSDTFIGRGATSESAFSDAQQSYDGDLGGGHQILQREVVTEQEGIQIAHRLLQDDDPRISDKWGPFGAIPVVLDVRTYNVPTTFSYAPGRTWELEQAALLKAVTPLVKLEAGETIKVAQLTSYVDGRANRTKCHARVIITRAHYRTVEFTADIIPTDDYLKRQAQTDMAAQLHVKLKPGEKIVSVIEQATAPGKPKVTVTATKGATKTRYVVSSSDGRNTPYGTWETGFDSQADARAWVTTSLRDATFQRASFGYEVYAITRRVDGQALVTGERRIETAKRTYQATIALPLDSAKADGWVFAGWIPD